MAFQLWALDTTGAQAIVVNDVDSAPKWQLLSADRNWEPIDLRDNSDAFRWSLSIPAITNVEGLTGHKFEKLDTLVSAIEELCASAMEPPKTISITEALRYCPPDIITERVNGDWARQQSSSIIFWYCVLLGAEQLSIREPTRTRYPYLQYKDYVSLSLACVAQWIGLELAPDEHVHWSLNLVSREARRLRRQHSEWLELHSFDRNSYRRPNFGIFRSRNFYNIYSAGDSGLFRDRLARVARTHTEVLYGYALHADEREWSRLLSNKEDASKRLQALYSAVNRLSDSSYRGMILELLSGTSEDEIALHVGMELSRVQDICSEILEQLEHWLSSERNNT